MPLPAAPLTRRTVLGAGLSALASVLAARAGFAADPQGRFLVFGDSQAGGLAAGVQRYFRADRQCRVLDRSKISTGLVARGSYDWPSQARTLATSERPDVALAMFGANDRPPAGAGAKGDQALFSRFSEAYGARVSEVAQSFQRARVPLVWLGHPIVKDPAYAADMAALNEIFSARARAEGATFVSTWELFTDASGNYSPYGRGVDGQTTRLRADDGVHMTAAGYDVIANLLAPTLQRYRPGGAPPPA